jgi:mono/diheme cytochrome c family protein
MKRFGSWLRHFFFPPASSSRLAKILPYLVIVVLIVLILAGVSAGWEYTNASSFCGLTCHTMPPEYITHQNTLHNRVTCEECHLGRAPLVQQIIRKIDYGQGTFFALVLKTYEYPIRAKNMRPARDVCETCHYPQTFANDTLVELKRYSPDAENSLTRIHLILKTGGGSQREGLGFGIHWHIENPVYFYASDPERQVIPYVRVVKEDGTTVEYVDVESGFDPASITADQLQTMDCMSCHNRTSHNIQTPEDLVDDLMSRNEISPAIPEIRLKAVEALRGTYSSYDEARQGIEALRQYYTSQHADFTAQNQASIDKVVEVLWTAYQNNVFIDQKVSWDTHPDNAGHKNSPGCLRCHDGKHLDNANQAIRLECNLCHSIPVVSTASDFLTRIEISSGIEPESHLSANWITIHNQVFDETCSTCHSVDDPGGSSNTSFCSNSICHGSVWSYAGFDAPRLRQSLAEELKKYATPTPKPTRQPDESLDVMAEPGAATPTPTPASPAGVLTYEGEIKPLLNKCTACHGANGLEGLDLSNYAGILKGGENGAAIIPGDADNSLLVKVQTGSKPHFGQFTTNELAKIKAWITAGALEK